MAISSPAPEALAVNFVNLSPLAVFEAQLKTGLLGCWAAGLPPHPTKSKGKEKQDTHKF